MKPKKKKPAYEGLILQLLKTKEEISVAVIGHAAGTAKLNESNRKAIRRVLIRLEERGLIEAHGFGRARSYRLMSSEGSDASFEEFALSFKDIPLSSKSKLLLKYVSQSLQARKPVGYKQAFLDSYQPNKTFYLSHSQRAELLNAGISENKVRPAGTYARNILNRLLIDLSWNSSRLEGNTYSLMETKRLIELGEIVSGKDAAEAQMILNHKAAIEYIVESTIGEKITSHEVCSIHALLSENLLGDPDASGRIRKIAIGVGGSNYMPLENPYILKECFQVLVDKLNRIEDPFEQSLFALVHLSYLQAFEDVNKRTARLVANIPFIRANLRPLSFAEVGKEAYIKALLGVYEKNDISLFRDLFLWAYKRSAQRYSAIQQAMGEPNLLKLKYRSEIHEIIRAIILKKIAGSQVVSQIKLLMQEKNFPESEVEELFHLIEIEIVSLHDGNIARFKIRPSEFQEWKALQ